MARRKQKALPADVRDFWAGDGRAVHVVDDISDAIAVPVLEQLAAPEPPKKKKGAVVSELQSLFNDPALFDTWLSPRSSAGTEVFGSRATSLLYAYCKDGGIEAGKPFGVFGAPWVKHEGRMGVWLTSGEQRAFISGPVADFYEAVGSAQWNDLDTPPRQWGGAYVPWPKIKALWRNLYWQHRTRNMSARDTVAFLAKETAGDLKDFHLDALYWVTLRHDITPEGVSEWEWFLCRGNQGVDYWNEQGEEEEARTQALRRLWKALPE